MEAKKRNDALLALEASMLRFHYIGKAQPYGLYIFEINPKNELFLLGHAKDNKRRNKSLKKQTNIQARKYRSKGIR